MGSEETLGLEKVLGKVLGSVSGVGEGALVVGYVGRVVPQYLPAEGLWYESMVLASRDSQVVHEVLR